MGDPFPLLAAHGLIRHDANLIAVDFAEQPAV
jgi:hypothetical protein